MEYTSPYPEPAKERIQCEFCETTSSSEATKTRHMRAHTGEKRHVCPLEGCDAKFARADYLHKHWKIHQEVLREDDVTMPLRVASEAARSVGDGRSHLVDAQLTGFTPLGSPAGSPPGFASDVNEATAVPSSQSPRESSFSCEHCGKAFEYLSAKQRHVRPHFSVKEHFCYFPDCNATFMRHDHLINHLNNIHDPTEWTEEARAAQEAAERAYQNPTLNEEVKATPTPQPGHGISGRYHVEELTCPICGLMLSQPSARRRHVATVHADEKPWLCTAQRCGASFAIREYLHRHERIVHDVDPTPGGRHHNADVDFLAQNETRELDPNAASGIRAVPAPEQIRAVATAPEAAAVARSTSPVVLEGACSKVVAIAVPFANKERQDFRVNTSKRWSPRRCKICYRKFRLTSDLERHMKSSHNPEYAYLCDLPGCGKRLSRKTHLIAHKRLHELGRIVMPGIPSVDSESGSDRSEEIGDFEGKEHGNSLFEQDFEAQLLAAANGEVSNATTPQPPPAHPPVLGPNTQLEKNPFPSDASYLQDCIQRPQLSAGISCQACRLGNRKCSRGQPCDSCRIADRKCDYDLYRSTTTTNSCLPCRVAKCKCTGEQPCEQCRKSGRECVHPMRQQSEVGAIPKANHVRSMVHSDSQAESSRTPSHFFQRGQDTMDARETKQQQTTAESSAAATICYGCGKVFHTKSTFFEHAPCFSLPGGANSTMPQRQPEHITSAIGSRSAPLTIQDALNAARPSTSSPERHDSGQEGVTKLAPTVSPHFADAAAEKKALKVLNTVPSSDVIRILLGIAQRQPECRSIPPDELRSIIQGKPVQQEKLELTRKNHEIIRFEGEVEKARRQKVPANAALRTGSGLRLRDITRDDFETVVMDDYG